MKGNERTSKRIIEVLNTFMFYMIIISLVEFISTVTGAYVGVRIYTAVAIFSVVIVAFQYWFRRFWMQMISTAVVLVAMFFWMNSQYGLIIFIILSASSVGACIFVWTSRKKIVQMSMGELSVILIIYLMALGKEWEALADKMFIFTIIYVITAFVNKYLKESVVYCSQLEQARRVRVGIMRGNLKVVVPVLLLIFVAMQALSGGAVLRAMHSLVSSIKDGVIFLLRFLFSSDKSQIIKDAVMKEETQENLEDELEHLFVDTNFNMQIVMKFLVGIAAILAFAFILYELIKWIRFLIKRISEERVQKSVYADDVFQVTEEQIRLDSAYYNAYVDDAEGKGIRRKYKKIIRKCMKKGHQLDESQTPEERASDIKIQQDYDIMDLTHEYEAVRYGRNN